MTTSEDNDRRLTKVEERLNQDERELTALNTEVQLAKVDLTRRLDATQDDLKERIDNIKADIKADHTDINKSINNIEDEVRTLSKSLQKLYVTQEGSGTKIEFNEKIVWAIIGIICSVGFAYIQEIIRTGGVIG